MADRDKQQPAEIDAAALARLEEQSEPAIAKDREAPRPAPPTPAPARKG